jgi:hypothetical protein
MYTQRGVEAPIPAGFAEAEAHHHLGSQRCDLADVRVIKRERGRQGVRIGRAQVVEIAAERGSGSTSNPTSNWRRARSAW